MEVSLRKPQRAIFNKVKNNEGSYFRSYRKSCSATRVYWRLMTKDHSPIQNIPPGQMKPFFQLSLIDDLGGGQVKIKEGLVLAEKKKKQTKKK